MVGTIPRSCAPPSTRGDCYSHWTVVAMVETLVGHHEIDGLAGCITVVQRNVLRVRRPDPR